MHVVQTQARTRKRRMSRAFGGPTFESGDIWSGAHPNPRPWQRRRGFAMPARFRGRLRTGGYYGRGMTGGGGCSGAAELKFHDVEIDQSPVAALGDIAEDSCLTIAQGDGEQQRDGRKMCVKKIGWKFSLSLPSTIVAAETSDTVRVILYMDTQTNGAAATVALILADTNHEAFNNLEQGKRFRTLMDRTYTLVSKAGGGAAGTGFGEDRVDDAFYKNCSTAVTYDSTATTGAIATMRDNNIGVLTISKSGFASFSSRMRIRFTG